MNLLSLRQISMLGKSDSSPYYLSFAVTLLLLIVAWPKIFTYFPSFGDDITLILDSQSVNFKQWFYHGYSNWLISSEQYQNYFYTYSRPLTNFITYVSLSLFGSYDYLLVLNYIFMGTSSLVTLKLLRAVDVRAGALTLLFSLVILFFCPLIYSDFYLNYAYFQVELYFTFYMGFILAIIASRYRTAMCLMILSVLLKDNSFLLPLVACISVFLFYKGDQRTLKASVFLLTGYLAYVAIHLNLVGGLFRGSAGGDFVHIFGVFDLIKVPKSNDEVGFFSYLSFALLSLPSLINTDLLTHYKAADPFYVAVVSTVNILIILSAIYLFTKRRENERSVNVVLLFWLFSWVQYLLFHNTPRWGVECYVLSIILCFIAANKLRRWFSSIAFVMVVLWFVIPGYSNVTEFNNASIHYLDKYRDKENTFALYNELKGAAHNETLYLLNAPFGIKDHYLEKFFETGSKLKTLTHYELGVPESAGDSSQDILLINNKLVTISDGFKPNYIIDNNQDIDYKVVNINKKVVQTYEFNTGMPKNFIFFNPSTRWVEIWNVIDNKIQRKVLGRTNLDEASSSITVRVPMSCSRISKIDLHDHKKMNSLTGEILKSKLTQLDGECLLRDELPLKVLGRHIYIDIYDDGGLAYKDSFLRSLQSINL